MLHMGTSRRLAAVIGGLFLGLGTGGILFAAGVVPDGATPPIPIGSGAAGLGLGLIVAALIRDE